jgi:hypothetical protein
VSSPKPVFTVTRIGPRRDAINGQRYRLTISTLPGRSWVHGFREMSDELYVSALADRLAIRNALFDAHATGSVEL